MKQKNAHTGNEHPVAGPATGRFALTPRQQLALSVDRHLSVTANAGSGKTAVLVERYVRLLLLREATVDGVVVLTYTDRAAGELRRRIAPSIQEASLTSDTERAEFFASVREQLPNALIGTIHSFCARILREYAIEAGVDPDFGVLEGLDQRMAVAGAVGETLGTILRNEASEKTRLQLYSLLRAKGTSWVFRCVSLLLEKRDLLGRLTGSGGIYSLSDEHVLERWHTVLAEQAANELSDPALEADLERICVRAPDDLARFKYARNPADRGAAFLSLTESMFRKDGKLAASFAGSGAAARELAAEASRVRRRQLLLVPLLNLLLDRSNAQESHAALLAATRALLTASRLAIESYDRQKFAAGLLDYEDLQLRTRSLLANEHVRAALARRFRYVMVDEFQDTNFLQYELLLPLVTRYETGNLFVVGDPRQSIYGFRNADPAVFEASKRDILESRNGGAALALDESFRPLADIAAFVNLVFPRGREDGGFQPLVCARQNEFPGRVELLLHDQGPQEMSEGEMIAHRIVQMLGQGETVFGRQEQPHRVAPGDIAILIRSRTSLPELEDALIRHQIPYTVTGGVGFFQTQDLMDLFDYFQFLINPSDSAALAGILRSPFFHVSDAELFEVALERGEREFWEYISSPDFPVKKHQATARAAAMLEQDLTFGLRLPPVELLDRIVRQTSYVPLLAGDERGKQRLGNLEKLRQFARTAASGGFITLYDFVERLKVLINREENEGQEEVDAPDNAVRVMTVHAAKGLEFPVVILPRLHKRFQYDLEPYIDQQLGIGFSLPGDEEEEIWNPLSAFLREQSRRKTIEEEKRILYVACTRARDMLIVSGDWEPDREKVHSLNWILAGLLLNEKPQGGIIERTVEIERLRISNGSSGRRMEPHTLRVHIPTAPDLSGERSLAPKEEAPQMIRPELFIEPLDAKSKREEFTGEMLRTYVECPYRYFNRYLLGLPPDLVEEKSLKFEASVDVLLRHRNMEALSALIPSVRPDRLLPEFNPRILLPVAFAVAEGILSDTLPLVYRDAEGVWSLVRFGLDSGPPGAEDFVRQSLRFLLEFDALLLQRLHGAPLVRAELFTASTPERGMSLEFREADSKVIERKVRTVVRSILEERFEHRATPCPVCLAYVR